ncbi:putative protein serine/threonine kinase [Tieghemostelium lacteum]|uniref:non-specific serine/threonine protein kinase n=1 Tax=Tieghemostelium lacteum TaxID=361077 RepID=A0A151Z3F2_TIELA|nr:putative protein serine/threonine kinase [Tieghemostelium lacteum]|eukprot:KYQ88493.1 putative protein serine/threonine kinase [Tieghemostelium lacteum]
MSKFNYRSIEEYVVGEEIGRGSYGKVVLATHSKSNIKYCLKYLKIKHYDKSQDLHEANIWVELDHVSVIKYIDNFVYEKNWILVLEYANRKSLGELIWHRTKVQTIASSKTEFTYEEVMVYFIQMLYGLKYIHDKGIIHRDIKPENILLHERDGNPNGPHLVKISDFGVSKFLKVGDTTKTIIGTTLYFSPEMVKGETSYTHSADIWALGVVLYELLALKMPFEKDEIENYKFQPLNFKCEDFKPLNDLLKKMLKNNPNRPTANDILEFPFIKTFTVSNKFLVDLYKIKVVNRIDCLLKINKIQKHTPLPPIQTNQKDDDNFEKANQVTSQITQPTPPISIVPKSFKPLGPEKLIKELGLTKDEIDSADSTGMIIELIRLKLKEHKMKNIDKSKFVNTLQLHMEIFKSHNLTK